MYPENRLTKKVDASLQIAIFQPRTELLRKNISGSIDGDAIQNDITGASGTPPVSSELITGMTPHEQNGLKAPTTVARNTEMNGLPAKALVINFEAPDNLITTAMGMVIRRYGQIWIKDSNMNRAILSMCSMAKIFDFYHRR